MKAIKITTPHTITLFPVDGITKVVADKEELLIGIFTDKQDLTISFDTYEKMMGIWGDVESFMLDNRNAELSIDCPEDVTESYGDTA